MSPSVSFTVTQSQRDELDAYAAEKGFRTASNLIRYATIQHMRRYPMTVRKATKRPRAVQPDASGADPGGTP